MFNISVDLLFIIHFSATLFMTGLIWVVQVLHYPSYRYISLEKFSAYQNFHTEAITLIVGPVMLIEIFSGLFLLINSQFDRLHVLNFSGLCILWLATLFFSVPNHNKLHLGFNDQVINQLIQTNWIRTILWTLRSGLLIYILILATTSRRP